jgi:hypothetical protein
MSKQKNKTRLLELLGLHLKPYGFALNKNRAEFTKREKSGWNKFQLIFLNRSAGWEIDPGMLIRQNVVEDIYHKASSYEPKYHKTTPTVGITVEKIIDDGRQHRCYLNSSEDIEECLNYIAGIFADVVLPFFVKYSTMEALDKAVNVKSGKSIFSGLKYEGSVGLILARLSKNPEYFFFLDKYRRYYIDLNDGYYLPDYERLITVLDDLI